MSDYPNDPNQGSERKSSPFMPPSEIEPTPPHDPVADVLAEVEIIRAERLLRNPDTNYNQIHACRGLEPLTPQHALIDICMPEKAQETVEEIIAGVKHPEIMKKWGIPPTKGLLVYGPSGTGKTMLAHAIASELNSPIAEIKIDQILGEYLGDAERYTTEMFRNIWALGRQKSTVVVLIDELDSVFSSNTPGEKSGGAIETRNSIAGIFKREMTTHASDNSSVLFVATTNHLDRIDPALIRSGRFNTKLYFPLPDESVRTNIVVNQFMRDLNEDKPDTPVVMDLM